MGSLKHSTPSDGDDMCDEADKVLKEVLRDLLQERKREHTDMNKMLSVKDLAIPLFVLIPLLISGAVGMWQMSGYFSSLESRLASLKVQIENASKDRYTATNAFQICTNQQILNPEVKFACDKIFSIRPIDFSSLNKGNKL